MLIIVTVKAEIMENKFICPIYQECELDTPHFFHCQDSHCGQPMNSSNVELEGYCSTYCLQECK